MIEAKNVFSYQKFKDINLEYQSVLNYLKNLKNFDNDGLSISYDHKCNHVCQNVNGELKNKICGAKDISLLT
jgi:hypothetical protein